MTLKATLPWPVKFGIKALIGLCRIDYRLLKRAGIVEFGRMEDVVFACDVFRRHVQVPYESQASPIPAGTLLELGPGDSVATGFLGRFLGFERVILVDTGAFADLRPASLIALRESLARAGIIVPETPGRDARSDLAALGIQYLTQGVASLRTLKPCGLSHSFSNTVLQHVYRDELPEIVQLLGRAHAPGTLSVHSINFSDHFSGGFINQRLPDWLMESQLVKRGNLYTNRVVLRQYCELFAAAAFTLRRAHVEFHGAGDGIAVDYQSVDDMIRDTESRQAKRVFILLQKS